MSVPISIIQINNNSQLNVTTLITINAPPAPNAADLIYDLSIVNPLFPTIVPDVVTPSNAYHGGYDPISTGTINFNDNSSLVVTNSVKNVISDYSTKGIMELRSSNGNYYWDEVYTTPLGLYTYQAAALSLGTLYHFTSVNPNTIEFSTEDPNIIPKVNDYLVVQRFFDVNTFVNASTTDDLNNVIAYPLGETFQFQITSVTPPTGTSIPISSITFATVASSFSIVSATGANPIVITTSTAHGYSNNQEVVITGVTGNTAANGTFYAGAVATYTFALYSDVGLTTTVVGSGTGSGGSVTIPGVANQIVITTITPHGLTSGDQVNIEGAVDVPNANGTFIINVLNLTSFELLALDSVTPIIGSGSYTNGATVNVLPLYQIQLDKSFAPIGSIPFTVAGISTGTPAVVTTSTQHEYATGDKINILDSPTVTGITMTNFVTGIGGTYYIQVLSPTTFSLYVDSAFSVPVTSSGTWTSGGTVQEFPAQYIFVLLNRKNVSIDNELFIDTFRQTEIHRQQLLGDPFEQTNILDFTGPTNYLNYNSSGYLGVRNLLNGVIKSTDNTPFVIYDIQDDIQDRLNSDDDSVELHLPTVMVNSVVLPLVITNATNPVSPNPIIITTSSVHGLATGQQVIISGVVGNTAANGTYYASVISTVSFALYQDSSFITPIVGNGVYISGGSVVIVVAPNALTSPLILQNQGPILTDTSGAGNYTGLYFATAADPALRSYRFGWVMHDLRIIVIDDPELVTALGYNSNRNYTLPAPTLSTNNTIQNPTSTNPVIISGVKSTTPIIVTTATPHELQSGDKITITGVQPSALIPDGTYYIGSPTTSTFQLFADPALLSPIAGSGAYSSGGTASSFKLPYEYFITYRINGKHYNTAPYAQPLDFNFDVNGQVQINIPRLTNLVDSVNFQGFEAETFEIIIGKYEADPSNPSNIIGNAYVTLAPAISHTYNGTTHMLNTGSSERRRLVLKDASGLQVDATGHTAILSSADIEDGFGNWSLIPNTIPPIAISPGTAYPLVNILYDLVNTSANTSYGITQGIAANTYYNAIYGVPLYYDVSVLVPNSTLFAGNGIWNLGIVKYKQETTQYRMTINVPVLAGNWNSTTNPSYEAGNSLMNNKLISEIAFLIADPNGPPGSVLQAPYVYGKISPPIVKTNNSDLSFEISLDF